MALKLSLSGGAGARTLNAGTLSIGRGERNDWVLEDPDRHLSKTHCVVSIENGKYVLTDLSTNGVYINGARQPTVRDSRVVLTDGDEFRIGEYSIFVEEVAAAPEPARATGPLGRDDDPLDIDPLDDPLGAPMPRSGQRGGQGFSHPVRHVAPQQRADDPFDRQDDNRRRPADPDDDLFSGQKPAHQWEGPSQPDHADAPRHAMQMPRVIAPINPNEIDFDALIGDIDSLQPSRPPAPPQPQAPPRPAQHDPFAELDDLLAPPQPVAPAPPPPLPVAAPPPPAAVAPAPAPAPVAPQAAAPDAVRAAMQAFLDGAGVPTAPVGADPEATMRALGQVFRVMTEGLREVLMSRAAIKGELRVEQTMIRATNNNALKFSMTPEDAVIALMSVGRPGYMPPLAAAREAFDDLKTHELAVMAGVQTALVGLLRRFDPDALEARLAKGALSSVLPGARKARLWDSFRDTYKTIASEAEDDFQAVFGRAFAKAYMAQSRKDDV